MMRSLYTAASGMTGQQYNIDTISNNLSNVYTTGFKQNRVDFEDLLYQTTRTAGTPATELTVTPVGVQVGHGVKGRCNPEDVHPGCASEYGQRIGPCNRRRGLHEGNADRRYLRLYPRRFTED